MNFIDRTALGDMLAQRLEQFRGKDAVLLCLQESSLLPCLTIASQLRAWVYPLVYEPVYTPDQAHTLLGAFNQDGEFCPLPDSSITESDEPAESKATAEVEEIAKKQRKAAMKSIDGQIASYGLTLDKKQMTGRDVILVGDVITSILPLVVARQLLKDVSPRSLTAAIGNATPEVAQQARISAGQAEILDIVSGVTYDGNRYFEHDDKYTSEEKHTLTQHIATYWQ